MELYDVAQIAVRYRKGIAIISSLTLLITLLLCFLLPKRYTSYFVIVPSIGSNNLLSSEKAPNLLTSVRSYRAGAIDLLLPKIIESDEFMLEISRKKFPIWTERRLSLVSLSDLIGDSETALLPKKARRYVRIEIDKMSGSMKVSAETPYPDLSYHIAAFVLEKIMDQVSARRNELREANAAFYASRIKEAKNALMLAEEDLGSFFNKNRGWIESNDPEEKLEFDRLKRKQEIFASVYLELRKKSELEDIKIGTLVPPPMVLDYPEVPTIRSFPRRKLLLLIGLVLGAILSLLYVTARYGLEVQK